MNEASMALQKDLETALRYFDVPRSSSTPYTAVTQSRKKTKHVKRPMNAFMYWAQKERRKIIEHNPDIHNATISKTLGARWKSMTADEKKPHEYVAKLLGLLHQFEYPSYKYCPKKRGTRKADKDVKPLAAVPKAESVFEPVPDDRLSELSYSSTEEVKPIIYQPVQNVAELAITSETSGTVGSDLPIPSSLVSGNQNPVPKVPHCSTNAVSPSGSLQSEPFFDDEYPEKDSEYATDIDVFPDFLNLDFELQQLPPLHQGLLASKVKIESDYNNNCASTTAQLFPTPRVVTSLVAQPFLNFVVSLPPSPQSYDTNPNFLCDSILPLDLQDIEIFSDIGVPSLDTWQ